MKYRQNREGKGMFEQFYPNDYVDSTYGIHFEDYYKKGFRGVIFDIDNTLVEHGAPADACAIAFFDRMRELGYSVIMISNNKEPRVKTFCDAVGAPYIYKAGKPGVKSYLKAMEMMGTNDGNTLFVGDQLFTDIWGANRAGIYSILVKPIHPKEEIQIVLKRFLEKIVLFCYKRKYK